MKLLAILSLLSVVTANDKFQCQQGDNGMQCETFLNTYDCRIKTKIIKDGSKCTLYATDLKEKIKIVNCKYLCSAVFKKECKTFYSANC